MGTELVNTQSGELTIQEEQTPKELLMKAKSAAMALNDVITSNKRPPVMFNGKPYLEFAHWQVIATAYRFTVATKDAEYVKLGEIEGFKARAEVIDQTTGMVVGTAEAYCMKDEPNWKAKPLFQLASMAQTRAGAKSLANKFRFVAIMAGYEPTPSEEMLESNKPAVKMPEEKKVVSSVPTEEIEADIEWPSEVSHQGNNEPKLEDKKQGSKFLKKLYALATEKKVSKEKMTGAIRILCNKDSSLDLTDAECTFLIKQLEIDAIRNA